MFGAEGKIILEKTDPWRIIKKKQREGRSIEPKYAFLCYASARIDEVHGLRDLLQEEGIRCKMMPDDVPPGLPIHRAGQELVEHCGCMVLWLTEEANRSRYVNNEVKMAITGRIPIVVVLPEDLELDPVMQFFLHNISMIQLRGEGLDSPMLRYAVDMIRKLLEK